MFTNSHADRTNYLPHIRALLTQQRPALIPPRMGTRCQRGVRLLADGKHIPAPVKTEDIGQEYGHFFKGVRYEGEQSATLETLGRIQGDPALIKAEPVVQNTPSQEQLQLQNDVIADRVAVVDSDGCPLFINGKQYFVPAPPAKKPRKSIFEESEVADEDDDIIFDCQIIRDRPVKKVKQQFHSIKREIQLENERDVKDVEMIVPAPVLRQETPSAEEENSLIEEKVDTQNQTNQENSARSTTIHDHLSQIESQSDGVTTPLTQVTHMQEHANKGMTKITNHRGDQIFHYGVGPIISQSSKVAASKVQKRKRPVAPPVPDQKKLRVVEKNGRIN